VEPTEESKKNVMAEPDDQLDKVLLSLKKIERALEHVNSHKLMEIYNSIPKLLFYQFMKGIVFGLGSVLGATIVVSILVYLLSQIEFIPILGEWVKLISEEIQQ